MADFMKYSTEQRYRITLMVTSQQEFAIQGLFSLNGWAFSKVIEIPRVAGVSGVVAVTSKNDTSDDSNIGINKLENSHPNLLAKSSESSSYPTNVSTDQVKNENQISNEVIGGNGLCQEIKTETRDSEKDSADEINGATDEVKTIGPPDIEMDRARREFAGNCMPKNEKNTSIRVIDASKQSKKVRKTKKTVNKATSEFQKKIAERSRKVIEQFGEDKARVNKILYEDGDAERNRVDNHIDEMSLVMRKDDALVCCMCRVAFLDESKFKDHASVCLKNLFKLKDSHVHKCNDCPAYFRQAYTLLRHRQSELCAPGQERKATLLTCKYCNKIYPSKRRTEYILHIQAHINDRPFECDECGQKFVRWQTLKTHKRRHTGEKPYKCRQCDLTFSSITGQRTHEITRHSDLPKSFVCEKCGAAFKMNTGLKCHIREVHDIPVIYTCDFCSKEFSRKSSLVYHRKAHTNSRDKVCEICGKGFYRQSYLTHHMKRHNNERSFFCDLCGKGFYTKINLDDHRRSHTGDKPYSCAICNYQCAYYSNTVKHVRAKHQEVTDMKSVIVKSGSKTAVSTD